MADNLTAQRRHFAILIAEGKLSQRDCALEAGYSPKSADAQASQLLKNPEIMAEVRRIQAKAVAASLGSKAEALDKIWTMAEEAREEGARRHAYQGYELWLKASGNYTEKHALEHSGEVVQLVLKRPEVGRAGD